MSPVPATGAIPPAEVPRGSGTALSTTAGGRIYTATHVDAIKGGESAEVRARNRVVTLARRRRRDEHAGQRSRRDSHQAGAVHDLRRRSSRAGAVRCRPRSTGTAEDPYHYVRVLSGGGAGGDDLLIVGGEDHKSGQADDTAERHGRLEAWARERFPAMAQDCEFVWGGQVMEPIDGVAFIGLNPLDANNVYVATGDAGMGLTHGTIAGMLLTDLILGRAERLGRALRPVAQTRARRRATYLEGSGQRGRAVWRLGDRRRRRVGRADRPGRRRRAAARA